MPPVLIPSSLTSQGRERAGLLNYFTFRRVRESELFSLGKLRNVLLLFDLFLRISIARGHLFSRSERDDRTQYQLDEILPGHAALSDFRR
jgi:hypothetical protein